MRSERICSLGRHLANLNKDAADTYAAQWFERTLDDSAIRRLYLPDLYLTADSLLILLNNVSSGLVVYPAVIQKRIGAELPFMATENIIMSLVHKGKSRQDAHEKIRQLSQEAARGVKEGGRENDLIERVRRDGFFEGIWEELPRLMDARTFVGRAPEQVERFTGPKGEVQMALEKYSEDILKGQTADLKV